MGVARKVSEDGLKAMVQAWWKMRVVGPLDAMGWKVDRTSDSCGKRDNCGQAVER